VAKDVNTALQRVFIDHGQLTAANAHLELRMLAATGRYMRYVY